ncbi:MAG: hypothetical protein WC623_24255 [Pedobacter sp.]|uniref:hypothetical protein n=1 Tax=Pedobacter sp. TaxID=1411316 RepID=UPI003568BA86
MKYTAWGMAISQDIEACYYYINDCGAEEEDTEEQEEEEALPEAELGSQVSEKDWFLNDIGYMTLCGSKNGDNAK